MQAFPYTRAALRRLDPQDRGFVICVIVAAFGWFIQSQTVRFEQRHGGLFRQFLFLNRSPVVTADIGHVVGLAMVFGGVLVFMALAFAHAKQWQREQRHQLREAVR